MLKRDLSPILHQYTKFPTIAILGPRQSGKTTLAIKTFPQHTYLSFEDPEIRSFAASDPKRFLTEYENKHGLILDEFQYVPEILSYVQLAIDSKKRPGYFVLTGSQNFLVNQAITQSLAGRIGIVTLLPFSIHELETNSKILDQNTNETLFNGSYPRIYDQHLEPIQFYPSYIQTYIERDVRQLSTVGDLHLFQKFMQLCAGRIGQLLNIESLANDCGVTFATAKQWISTLEASYIIFLLQPHHNNFSKRLIKSPKLYFFDTGVACSLLRISAANVLTMHPLRGNIFENFIITDLYKQYCNKGLRPPLYFWRDQNGRYEVDCIIDRGIALTPIEIKSGETIVPDFFKGITDWSEIAQTDPANAYIVYGGNQKQSRSNGTIIGWRAAADLVTTIKEKGDKEIVS